jgi:Flp pilus assembly protein TadG
MKRSDTQRGGTLVEASITLMLLLMLLFGIIEFGRMYHMYHVATQAAREGARFSVAPCPFNLAIAGSCTAGNLPTSTEVQSRVETYMNNIGVPVPPATVTVNQNCSDATCAAWPGATHAVSETYTEVTVTVPYNFIFFGWTPTITTNVVMRNENN